MSETAILGKEARLTVEMPDGTIFMGNAMLIDITFNNNMQPFVAPDSFVGEHFLVGQRTWEITARGISAMETERGAYVEQVRQVRQAAEWKCDRCGAVWPRSVNRCSACGFYRSVVYE